MVPEVLAIDADRRWMLMRDMGAQTLDAVPGLEQWKAAVRTYAQLQVDWVDVTRRFSVAGCPAAGSCSWSRPLTGCSRIPWRSGQGRRTASP